MNVKKGVSAPRKGQTSLPQTLAHVIFFHIFFTQASTPSLRGPATQPLNTTIACDRVCFTLLWTRCYPYSWISILTLDFIFKKTNSLSPVPLCILTFHSYLIYFRIHMYYSMYDESIISRRRHRLDLIIF